MKLNIFKGKSTRTRVFTLITVGIILAVLLLNYLLTYLTGKNALYVDLTPETLYTLSDEMKSECAFVDELDDGDKEIEIIFCADPDSLESSVVTRVPYFMALQMQREYDNLSVKTFNATYNPTALSKYKTTSLSEIAQDDVIISYGNTYRIVSADSFWMKTSEGSYFSYNGEYKMASLLMSVTAVNKPVACFTKGHGETYYADGDPSSSSEAAGIYDLLSERGFDVKTVDLSKEELPADCTLVIINNPLTDFVYDTDKSDVFDYTSETKKLDRYLREKQGAIMVARDYANTELENLDSFLYEWGFDFGNAQVADASNHIGSYGDDSKDADKILGVYNTEEDSYANAVYGEFAAITSAPHTVFVNTGYIECSFYETDTKLEDGSSNVTITYNPFMTSYKTAIATKITADGTETVKKEEALDLAAVTVRYALDEVTSEAEYSYVFCSNSKDFFSNDLLYSNSYANFDIVSALVNNISRVDQYASMELGGSSMNSKKYGGKQLVYDTLSETPATVYNPDATYKETLEAITPGVKRTAVIIAVIAPLVPLTACIVIRIKRKYL
ncbi:MAG: Gldg family protein [Clostridia bacterium]|nr:Gldg family protein [Clostridia bacterium]